MKRYEDMTADQRREEYAAVRKAYEAQKALGLKDRKSTRLNSSHT